MSGASYFKRQKLLDAFRAFVNQYQNATNREQLAALALEKLASVDNLQLQGNAVHRESLYSSLLNLAGCVPDSDTEVTEKLTVLLLKYPLEQEKIALCNAWWRYRTGVLENILRTERWIAPSKRYLMDYESSFFVAFKFGHQDWIEKFLADFEAGEFYSTRYHLAAGLFDSDAELRQTARLFFKRISLERRQNMLELFAGELAADARYKLSTGYEVGFKLLNGDVDYKWYDPDRIQFLAEHAYFSAETPKVSIIVALVNGTFFGLIEENYTTIQILVGLLSIPDLVAQTEAVLRNLRTPEGQSNLCELFLYKQNHQAGTLAAEAGYVPRDLTHKLVFFFLTRQFARYDDLDFNYSKLRRFYEGAPTFQRRWIAQTIKQSGNPAYLDILSFKQTSPEVEISSIQNKAIVQVLCDTANWAALWQKVLELPFPASVSALGRLLKSDWQPAEPKEKELYQKLAGLLRSKIARPTQLRATLPPALPYARLEVAHKINSFVFTPDSQHILIAPNDWERPQLLDWNFWQGKEDVKILFGFESPFDLLKFAPDGTFFLAGQPGELPSGSQVYAWERWDELASLRRLDRQPGVVTLLEALPNRRLLVSRDYQLPQVLDTATGQIERTLRSYRFPHNKINGGLVIPERHVLILYGEHYAEYSFTTFDAEESSKFSQVPIKSSLYDPSLQKVLVGNADGLVYKIDITPLMDWDWSIYYSFGTSREHPATVCGLAALPDHKLIAMGATDGQVVFRSSVRDTWLLRFRSPGGQLKGLQISPDERFMAIAESDTILSLWDLQLLAAPKLLEQPLLHVKIQDMALLKMLEDNNTAPQPVQNSLAYIRAILNYRFSYDIEIEAVREVVPTKFDIEL